MSPDPAVVEFLESVVYGDRRDPLAVGIRGILSMLSAAYRAGIWLYLLPFKIGLRKKKRLDKPVVSVGNLTVGGTGKTPMVQYIAKGLISRGMNPAVLSYGYGGSLRGRLGIVSDKSEVLLTAKAAGDEPVMLAASMPGVPVLVCRDRARSGRVAVRELGADVLVLDDGFQVWKLHRNLDIVLANAQNPFDNGRTLPAGRLREPPAALSRAHCVIATGACEPRSRKELTARIHAAAPEVPVYFARFKPSGIAPLGDSSDLGVETIHKKRVLALSSIANPDSFEETVAATGAVIVDKMRFPDHHLYYAEDIESINRHADERAAEIIVTTGKDAVKLDEQQFAVPIVALTVELKLDNEASFWKLIAEKLGIG